MTDIAGLHAQALEATGRIVRGVPAGRWDAATPCAGWDARALVNHLVSGNLWAAGLAADGTIEGIGSWLDGDMLGDDPAAAPDPQQMEAFRQIVEPPLEAFRSLGTFGRGGGPPCPLTL